MDANQNDQYLYLPSFLGSNPQFNDQILDLQSFLGRYTQFNENQIRWLIVKKKENGLEPAIKRLGRRLYIDVPLFFKWVQSQKS